MKIFETRNLARTAGLLAIGALACTASLLTGRAEVSAQVGTGDFWLFQPQQPGPVGRAWCNPARTVEYWAYVVGEYQFSSAENGPGQRWNLGVEATPSPGYANYASFKTAVRALPQFAGKSIRFQNHSMIEEVVNN